MSDAYWHPDEVRTVRCFRYVLFPNRRKIGRKQCSQAYPAGHCTRGPLSRCPLRGRKTVRCLCRSRGWPNGQDRSLAEVDLWKISEVASAGGLVSFQTTRAQCPLLAQSGHSSCRKCPLLAQSGHPLVALHMSAFGVKRTWLFALHMSAFDPKRTSPAYSKFPNERLTCA